MDIDLKPLDEQVVVITGASSGIGLATARAAAREGARVVLVARNRSALAQIEESLRGDGGDVIHVVADVADRADVERVARTAIERFGGFDTWVNDAGVSIWGRLQDVSDADNRRLFDTNFWGLVHGSLVAVRHLETRGGALINLGSVASDIALPLQGMYSASKHAVKGFTDALRMELEERHAPVSVTLIKPASIDTPLPHNARNYTDREPTLPPPVYTPEEVARAILHAAVTPRRDIYVGGSAKVLSTVGRLAPRFFDWAGSRQMGSQLSREIPRHPEGALYHPGSDDGHVRGGHRGYVMGSSLYTRGVLSPMASGFAMGLAGLAALVLLGSGRRRGRLGR